MRDLVLVVTSVVLTALFSRTYGHRRLLYRVREQLEVLNALPPAWESQRAELQRLAELDVRRYIQVRNPKTPVHHRLMLLMNFALGGFVLFTVAGATFMPISEDAKDLLALAGLLVVSIAVTLSLGTLVRNRDEVRRELAGETKAKVSDDLTQEASPNKVTQPHERDASPEARG